jgi:hypothetical protein
MNALDENKHEYLLAYCRRMEAIELLRFLPSV